MAKVKVDMCPLHGDYITPFPCSACFFYNKVWEQYGDDYNYFTAKLVRGEISREEYKDAVDREWKTAVKRVLELYPEYEQCPLKEGD